MVVIIMANLLEEFVLVGFLVMCLSFALVACDDGKSLHFDFFILGLFWYLKLEFIILFTQLMLDIFAYFTLIVFKYLVRGHATLP